MWVETPSAGQYLNLLVCLLNMKLDNNFQEMRIGAEASSLSLIHTHCCWFLNCGVINNTYITSLLFQWPVPKTQLLIASIAFSFTQHRLRSHPRENWPFTILDFCVCMEFVHWQFVIMLKSKACIEFLNASKGTQKQSTIGYASCIHVSHCQLNWTNFYT